MAGRAEVAVLLPVYDRAEALSRSIESLGDQRLPFDVVIVDDGSQPPLTAPVHPGEGEVHLLRQDSNQGIVAALNRGLSFIAEHGHPFVARLDAGDLALPGRLQRQLEFLRSHPDHALVGSHVRYVDGAGRERGMLLLPTEHDDLRRKIHYRACFVHSAVMYRTRAVLELSGYSARFPHAEDYDLFIRLMRLHKTANLREPLTAVELTTDSISKANSTRQALSILRILLAHADWSLAASYFGLAKQLAVVMVPADGVLWAKRTFWPSIIDGRRSSSRRAD